MRTRRNTSRSAGRVRAHQLDRLGIDGRKPAQRVHEHREEAQHRGDRHLRPRAEEPEPGVRDRRERDDRNRVRGDHVRHQRVAERTPAREDERDDDRRAPLPRTNPPTASLNVIHAPRPEQRRARRPERRDDVGEPRQQEVLARRARREEPTARPRGRGRRPRWPAPTRGSARRSAATRRTWIRELLTRSRPPLRAVSSTSSAPVACSVSRTSVTSSKNRGSSRVVGRTRLGQVDGDDARDPPRPRRT